MGHDHINAVTFAWHGRGVRGSRFNYTVRLAEEIAEGTRGWRWGDRLAANLATAALLGRAADLAYAQGVLMRFYPYPDVQP